MTAEKIMDDFEKPQNTRERLLNDFKRFRHDFIEDIPDEILLPDMPNYHLYKCRTNFFNSIAACILLLRHEGIKLSDEGERKCDEFFGYCKTIRGTTRRYQKSDIDKANQILDILIKELS